jgi:hypothetical protein
MPNQSKAQPDTHRDPQLAEIDPSGKSDKKIGLRDLPALSLFCSRRKWKSG